MNHDWWPDQRTLYSHFVLIKLVKSIRTYFRVVFAYSTITHAAANNSGPDWADSDIIASHRRHRHCPTALYSRGLRTIIWHCFKVLAVRGGKSCTRTYADAHRQRYTCVNTGTTFACADSFTVAQSIRSSCLLSLPASCRIIVLVNLHYLYNPKQTSKVPLPPV